MSNREHASIDIAVGGNKTSNDIPDTETKPNPDSAAMPNGTSLDARAPLDPGSICSVLTIHKKFDKMLQQLVELPVDESPSDVKQKQLGHALVVKRILKKKTGDIETTKLQINSPHILSALRKVVKYFPEEPSLFDKKLKIQSPYPILYHHWDELDELRNTADGEERMHLDLLMEFLEREIGEDRNQACKMVENGFISFCLLWTIFKPGTLVLHEEHGHQQVFRFEGATYGKNAKTSEKYLRLQLIYTDFDGTSFERATKTADVCQTELKQPSAITSLSYFPLQYRANAEGLLERLEERGKRFLQIGGVQLQRYDGVMLAIPEKDVSQTSTSICANLTCVPRIRILPQAGSCLVFVILWVAVNLRSRSFHLSKCTDESSSTLKRLMKKTPNTSRRCRTAKAHAVSCCGS